jgi:hypothetical protein
MMNTQEAYAAGFKQACVRRGFNPEAVIKAAQQIDKFAQVPVPMGAMPMAAQPQPAAAPANPQEAGQQAMGLPGTLQQLGPNLAGALQAGMGQQTPTNVGQGPLGIAAGGKVDPEQAVSDKGAPKPSVGADT